MRQYEDLIQPQIRDCGLQFVYLMHRCRGRAREATEGCTFLGPKAEPIGARETVTNIFENAYKLARIFIESILSETKRTTGEFRLLSSPRMKLPN